MTDEDMKQYLPYMREAVALSLESMGCHDAAKDYSNGVYDQSFKPTNPTYQAIKLMVEGWKPETKEDVAREMLARAYPLSASSLRSGVSVPNEQAIAYLARCLPDGIKIADLPEVE